MESLFFNLQKDKQFKRQTQLLRLLSENANQCSTAELAGTLECSMPTLAKELSYLNIVLKNYNVKLTTSVTGHVTLTYATNISIDSMITILTKDTLVFQIMWSILHNKKWTLQQAILELDSSRSSLLRTIGYMNEVLQEYNLLISTKTIDFIGNEEDVRVCLFAFYSAFGNSTIISAESEAEADYLVELGKRLGLPRLHLCHFRVSIWLSITRIRWRHKCFVSLAKEVEVAIANKKDLQIFNKLMQTLFRHYYQFGKLPQDEVSWAFITSLHCVSYSSNYSSSIPTPDFIFRRLEYPEIVTATHKFLENVFPQQLIQEGALEKMEACLINTRLLSKVTSNFELIEPRLKALAESIHSELYQMWYQHLGDLKKSEGFSFSHLRDVAVMLTTLHTAVKKQQKQKPVRILFAFQGEAGFDDYLAETTKLFITEKVQADYCLEKAVTKKRIKQAEADLVVCNYDVHLINDITCPIIRLSNIPTLIDWGVVRDAITRLVEQE